MSICQWILANSNFNKILLYILCNTTSEIKLLIIPNIIGFFLPFNEDHII